VILENVEGFMGLDYDKRREVFVVTFDDDKTNTGEFVRALKESGFRIKGKPKLIQ
jgi:copper chaperone CopZ